MSATRMIRLSGILTPAEEGDYLAECPELEIFTEGDNEEHAWQMLMEAIDLYFETAKKLGHYEGLCKRLWASQNCQQIETIYNRLSPEDCLKRFDRQLIPA